MDTDLFKKLNELSINIKPEFNTEKTIRNGSQWGIFKKLQFEGHDISLAWFGDWAKGTRGEWRSELNGLSDNKTAQGQIDLQIKKALEEERIARGVIWDEQAKISSEEFTTFATTGTTSYLERKQIPLLYGSRIAPNENGDKIVIVPLRDTGGNLWNYQRIYSQKLSKGDKFFQAGARIEGLFHTLDQTADSQQPRTLSRRLEILYGSDFAKKETDVFICEGFATAASVQMAYPEKAVVCAFNAGNLGPVARTIFETFPKAKIIFCADNDAYTIYRDKPYNVGVEKARRAAGDVNGHVVYPIFKSPQKTLTDFNDLHAAEGLDTVRDQIEHPEKYRSGIEPMILQHTKSGVPRPPTEQQIAGYLLKFFGDKIIRQDKSLFKYTGTHWVELDSMAQDKIKQMIGVASGNTLGIRDINNAFQFFFTHCPTVPVGLSLFMPNPYAANFQDQTLHLEQTARAFTVTPRPHAKEDFLTNVLPFDYPTQDAPAPKFRAMIERLWAKNPDKKEVIEFVQMLMGACLTPAFPIITIFQGRPQSGKSTIIKLLVKMLRTENLCSVQMCEMHGFNMETMIGKLVNFDTDIDIHRPMRDSEVKKIVDRMPRTIRRKGRVDVTAFLPAVHLFACNGLPTSLDGASHAYGHRLAIIPTYSFETTGDHDLDFAQSLWDEEREGVLAFAVEGLKKLAARGGHYPIVESSKKLILEMEDSSDIFSQFLQCLDEGDVMDGNTILIRHPEARIPRSKLGQLFMSWQIENEPNIRNRISVRAAYGRLASKGFEVRQGDRTHAGIRMVHGVGALVRGDGVC